MATRIVGKRLKPGGDPVELYRFDTAAPPHTEVQRFAFGLWRDSASVSEPIKTIMTVVADVQRGLLVDLPVESFDKLDAGITRVQAALFSYAANCSPPDSLMNWDWEDWNSSLRKHQARVVMKTLFTMGSHSWWMIEGGWLTPIAGRPIAAGFIQKMETVQQASLESAANKVFAKAANDIVMLPDRIATKIGTMHGYGLGIRDKELCEGIALSWASLNEEERKRRLHEQQARAAAARAQEEERERARLIEEERQRRIANGDVSALDDQGLASRLRAKRAKGTGTS